jgi:hypothetical protein
LMHTPGYGNRLFLPPLFHPHKICLMSSQLAWGFQIENISHGYTNFY